MPRQYPTPESLRDAYEFDLRLEQMRRQQYLLTAAVMLLAAALVGFGWYAYPILKSRSAALADFPHSLTTLQKDVFTLREQARATNAKLEDWNSRQEDLRSQVSKARGEFTGGVEGAGQSPVSAERSPRPANSLPDQFGVKRIEFELATNHGRQVVPGIALEITGTDARAQRVTGSVRVIPQNRTIRLRQQKTQDPIFLTSFADGRTRELVITRVTSTGAAGYVLVPAEANSVTNRGPGE